MPYSVQCRGYSKKTVNQLYNYLTVLGAAIKCKPPSEITVEIGTHSKTVKIMLNIFAVTIVVNPPERKLAKRTSVQCDDFFFNFVAIFCYLTFDKN